MYESKYKHRHEDRRKALSVPKEKKIIWTNTAENDLRRLAALGSTRAQALQQLASRQPQQPYQQRQQRASQLLGEMCGITNAFRGVF